MKAMTTTQQPTHTDHAASQQPAVDPFEGVACSPDGIPLTVLKVLQRPDAFQLFLDVLLAEIGDNPTLRMRAHFLLMWGLAHGQYRLPDDAPSSRATTPPSSASPSPDDRAAGAERLAARRQADEQHMAARRHAHEQALVALDDNDDVPVDYGDVLHIMTALQRAIAAVDPYVAGDMAGPYPDEYACFVDLANDARTLAALAQAVAAREVRHARRTETETAAD